MDRRPTVSIYRQFLPISAEAVNESFRVMYQNHKPPVRRREDPKSSDLSTITLKSVDCEVDVVTILGNFAVARLVSEDFCWQLAYSAHLAAKPSRRHRTERADWRAEGGDLCVLRSRIRQQASSAGLPVRPWGARSWLSGGW